MSGSRAGVTGAVVQEVVAAMMRDLLRAGSRIETSVTGRQETLL